MCVCVLDRGLISVHVSPCTFIVIYVCLSLLLFFFSALSVCFKKKAPIPKPVTPFKYFFYPFPPLLFSFSLSLRYIVTHSLSLYILSPDLQMLYI